MLHAPSKQAVLAQLDTILESVEFAASQRSRELLRYIVLKTLKGDSDRLKGYTIGLDVFGRDETFDPMQDAIVRVQTMRLRKMLDHFYSTTENDNENIVQISIPKGQYSATFEYLQITSNFDKIEETIIPKTARKFIRKIRLIPRQWLFWIIPFAIAAGIFIIFPNISLDSPASDRPQIAIMPFLTDSDVGNKHLGVKLRDALALSLGKQKLFAITLPSSERDLQNEPNRPLIYVTANVRNIDGQTSVHASLYKTDNKALLWSANWEDKTSLTTLAERIAHELHLQLIHAVRVMLKDDANAWTKPWYLYINAAWTPGDAEDSLDWEMKRVEQARKALAIDPDYTPAHAVLADKLAYLANVDVELASKGARAEAAVHAKRALMEASTDANIAANIANYYWHMGDLEYSANMALLASKLDIGNPVPAFQSRVHDVTCARVTKETLQFAEDFDASLQPDSTLHWLSLTWLNQLYLNNGDLDRALASGQESFAIFRTPDTSLRLATTLVAKGRTDEATRVIAFIAPNWPHLNIHDYVRSTMVRRCGDQDQAQRIIQMYQAMAEAVCSGSPEAKYC